MIVHLKLIIVLDCYVRVFYVCTCLCVYVRVCVLFLGVIVLSDVKRRRRRKGGEGKRRRRREGEEKSTRRDVVMGRRGRGA